MEKKLLALMTVFLLVGLFFGYAVHVPPRPIQLEEKVGEIETKLDSLETQIEKLNSQKAEQEEKLHENDETIAGLNDQIVGLIGQLDQLKAQIAEQEGKLVEKDETIEVLTGQVEESNTKLKQISDTLTEKDKTVESLNDRIEELNNELSQVSETRILDISFSPKGECEDQIITCINKANSTIHILIYSFTLDSIGEALITAHNRGVEVMVVFEKSQVSQYSEYQTLLAAGVPVRNDTNSKLMHHKVMIVDGIILLIGSFNWSKSAQEYNNENLIIIQSTYIATTYEEEFQEIWVESA